MEEEWRIRDLEARHKPASTSQTFTGAGVLCEGDVGRCVFTSALEDMLEGRFSLPEYRGGASKFTECNHVVL